MTEIWATRRFLDGVFDFDSWLNAFRKGFASESEKPSGPGLFPNFICLIAS